MEGWCVCVLFRGKLVSGGRLVYICGVGRILVYLWCLAEGWCGVWKVHISVVVSDERLVCLGCLMED